MGRWEIVGAVRLTTSSTLVSFGGASQARLSGTTISADRSQHGRERSRIIIKVGKCRQGWLWRFPSSSSPIIHPVPCLSCAYYLLPTAYCHRQRIACQLPVASSQLLPTTPPTTPPQSNSSGNDGEQHLPGLVVSSRSVIIRGVPFLPFRTGLLLASLRKIPLARGKTHHNSSLLLLRYHHYCYGTYAVTNYSTSAAATAVPTVSVPTSECCSDSS